MVMCNLSKLMGLQLLLLAQISLCVIEMFCLRQLFSRAQERNMLGLDISLSLWGMVELIDKFGCSILIDGKIACALLMHGVSLHVIFWSYGSCARVDAYVLGGLS